MLCATVTLTALVYIDLVGPGFETLLDLYITMLHFDYIYPLFLFNSW